MFLSSSILFPCWSYLMAVWHDFLTHNRNRWKNDRLFTFQLNFVKFFLPVAWEEWGNEDSFYSIVQSKIEIIKRKQLLGLRIGYSFAIFMVFGSLFPPLALIAMIAIICRTLWEEKLTNVMILEGNKNYPENNWIIDYLEIECENIERNFYPVVRFILVLTCAMYGFLLFDICGDENGWSYGIIPAIIMVLFIPCCLYSAQRMVRRRLS